MQLQSSNVFEQITATPTFLHSRVEMLGDEFTVCTHLKELIRADSKQFESLGETPQNTTCSYVTNDLWTLLFLQRKGVRDAQANWSLTPYAPSCSKTKVGIEYQ